MFILELTGNKTRINVASPMAKMLLRIQLYLTDSKFSNDVRGFNTEKFITKASQKLY